MNVAAYCREEAYHAFATSLGEIETTRGLVRTASAIALHENPRAEVRQCEAILDSIVQLVRRRAPSRQPRAVVAHLHDVLFEVIGFRGNVQNYYDPANSYLPGVLQTKRGIPITLSLLYKAVAEPLGLEVWGLNIPGHFLIEVAIDRHQKPMYVDPFYGGALMSEQEIQLLAAKATGRASELADLSLARATHRAWISRMLLNLQVIFSRTDRQRDVYAMQELQALL